jgi:hypothetical protein
MRGCTILNTKYKPPRLRAWAILIRMRNNEFIEGVNIIAKYMPETEKEGFGVHAEHDQLWFGADEWVTDEKDRKRLDEIGWFVNEDSWSCWA